MRLSQLNLTAVRDSCRPKRSEDREEMTVSRRQMLSLAGAATVGVTPALKALERFGTRIEVRGDDHRVAFLLDGKERWVIDAARFSGQPTLSLEQRKGFVRVTLKRARYPGTDISADLIAELREGALSPRLSLTMAFGQFRSEMNAEKFLSGAAPMRSTVTLGRTTERLASGYSLTLGGRATAEFRPDWTLKLRGSHLAAVSTPTGRLLSGVAILALLDPTHPSVFSKVPAQRSRITLKRGDLEWKLSALLPTTISQHGATPGGELAGAFDQTHLELSEQKSALIAEANGEHVALTFKPTGSLLDMEDEPFRYPLQSPRYIRVFGHDQRPTTNDQRPTTNNEWALVASFHQDPVWLRTEGFALEVGDGPGAGLFELTSSSGLRAQGSGLTAHSSRLTYAPALLRMITPVAGAITEPVALKEGTTLQLHHSRVRPKAKEGVVHVRTHPDKPKLYELQAVNLVASLLRAKDLMVLRLEYVGYYLQVGGGKPPRLIRIDPKIGGLVVHFPPQHIQEEAYSVADGESPGGPGSVQTRLAKESRLAFAIPQAVTEINYAIKDLLNWGGFTPVIAGNAYSQQYFTQHPPSSSLVPVQPDNYTTAIEAPYRLLMSTNETSGWVHMGDDADTTFNEVTELWHTRMGVVQGNSIDEIGSPEFRTMRAIWSPDFTADPSAVPPPYSGPTTADPFRPSLDTHDRDNLVHLTSNFALQSDGFLPLPVNIERLMLSSLGAWMALHGVWEPLPPVPGDLDVVAWRHQMTMGRDQYVKVAYRGFMYPFANKAAFIKVTDREFVTGRNGEVDAYLIQKFFVIVRQPELTYNFNPNDQNTSDYPNAWTSPNGGANGGRKMPFKKVTIKTLVTPDLLDPNTDPNGGALHVSLVNKNTSATQSPSLGQYGFWPTWNNNVTGTPTPQDVIWHIVAVDWNGQTSEFATPLLFVASEVATPQEPLTLVNPSSPPSTAPYENANFQALQGVKTAYAADARSTIQMNNQKVALAPQSPYPNPTDATKVVDTSHETITMQWSADLVPSSFATLPPNIADHPWFYPTLAQAGVIIPAVKHMMGITAPQQIKINNTFITHGLNLDAGGNPTNTISNAVNKGQVFLDMITTQALTFGGTQPNGTRVSPTVGQPNITIKSISALFGTVGDDGDTFATQGFKPANFFPTSLPADPTQQAPTFDPLSTIILGFFTLKDVIDALGLGDLAKIPQTITQYIPPQLPTKIHVGHDWTTNLQDFLIFKAHLYDPPNTQAYLGFKISADVPIPDITNPQVPTPSFHIEGGIYNFYLDFGIVVLPFNHLIFTEDDGKKPDTDCDVGNITFTGFLSFINGIEKFMSNFSGGSGKAKALAMKNGIKAADAGPGSGDGPYLDVDENGITAGFNLSIPDITLGVLSLQNISLGAEAIVPFIANPIQLNFYFCTRENPFMLTVYIFDGGGFVGLGLQPQGVSTLEASFEAGVNFDLNLGVASGSVSAQLGFYMKLDFLPHPGNGSLTGFVDIKGSVNVLDLISASIEIYLGLTYTEPGGKLTGTAAIYVEVHVLFFSASVKLGPVTKTFAGGSSKAAQLHDNLTPTIAAGPAKIGDLLTKPQWKAYCQAFA